MITFCRDDLPRIFKVLLVTVALSGCFEEEQTQYSPEFSADPPTAKVVFQFGIHPLHNPERLHNIFNPLMELLTREIPDVTFRVEASRDYAAYDAKLYARQFEFSLPNPYQTVNSLEHGYRVFGKMGDDENFRGIFVTRKDGGITKPTDLKGKAVSFPAPTALAATMLPQYYLQINGVEVMQDIEVRYVGSQESSIMNAYLGNTAAGATWPPPWRLLKSERPELEEEMHVIWSTDPLPNNGLVIRDDVPADIEKRVSDILFSLHENPEGQTILKSMDLSQFEAATNETYAPVIEFLETFSNTVRPLD